MQNLVLSSTNVRLATSTKADGHTSFNHISDEQTIKNIIGVTSSLNWQITGYAFMRIKYSAGSTFDVIKLIESEDDAFSTVSPKHAYFTDALITNRPNVCLMLPTADCYPVTLYDPVNQILGLAHMGWHSTHAHLLAKMIDLMVEKYSSKPSRMIVHFGPGIPASNYIFENPIQLNLPGWKPYVKQVKDGYAIDLLKYNLDQLDLSGIEKEHIDLDKRDTVNADELESNYMHNKQNLPVARRFLTCAMIDPTIA